MTKKVLNATRGQNEVEQYLNDIVHPLKSEYELLRNIVKNSNPKLNERIKWNAPSYYYIQDIVTFGPRKADSIMLVFHHPFVVEIKSPVLEGKYKDRRLVYFKSMADVRKNKIEITRIINEIISFIDASRQ